MTGVRRGEQDTTGGTEDIARRRAAAVEAADALRTAIEELVNTEAPADLLTAATESIHQALRHLHGHRRPAHQLASLDVRMSGARIHSPVTGPANPIAPPVRIRPTGDGVEARVVLGRAYEGPPGYAHGGVSAMILDEVLGRAAVEAGRYGVTGELRIRYLRPVPLRTPILVRAAVSEENRRRTTVMGTVTTVEDPGTVLIRASGDFIRLPDDKRRAYFGRLINADGSPAVGYHLRPTASE